MQNNRAGVSKSVALMRGENSIVPTMTNNVVVGNFVLPASGVHPKMRATMPNKSNGWLIIAAPEKTNLPRNKSCKTMNSH